MDLKSYLLIQNISEKLYEKLISGEEVLPELESYGNIIAENVCSDFYEIVKEKLIVEEVFFYYDDEYYRQGATTCVVKAQFKNNADLVVNFECLLDHQQILLRIKGQPSDEKLNGVISQIEGKYNSEGLIELKSIQS